MRLPTATAALLIFTALLTGCFGGDDVGLEETGDDSDPDKGRVVVLVHDDALLPLGNATVGIQELETQERTDERGRAVFEDVEPGTYTVHAQALGYESAAQRAQVETGGEASVEFSLNPLAVAEAFHENYVYEGFMGCGGGLIVVVFTGPCGDSNHDVAFDTQIPPGRADQLMTVVDEMVWEANTALSSPELRLALWQNPNCDPVCDPDHEYGDETGPSPVYVRADEPFQGISDENEPEANNLTHQAWTPGSSDNPPIVVIVIQQPFQVHTAVFYGVEAPEGYSGLPDA